MSINSASRFLSVEQSSGVIKKTRVEMGVLSEHTSDSVALSSRAKVCACFVIASNIVLILIVLSHLQKQALRDKLLLNSGLAIFVLTVLWILYKRTVGRVVAYVSS